MYSDSYHPEHTMVNLTRGELTGRSNNTPDDTGSTEYLSEWANEAILLVRTTHVRNVGEHPSLHTKLDGASNDSSNNL